MFLLKATTKSMEFLALQFPDRIQRIVMVNVGESTSPMGSYGIDKSVNCTNVGPWGSQCPFLVGSVGNQVMAEPVSVMNTLPLGRVGCLSTEKAPSFPPWSHGPWESWKVSVFC